jgi:hypothetical protein
VGLWSTCQGFVDARRPTDATLAAELPVVLDRKLEDSDQRLIEAVAATVAAWPTTAKSDRF